MMHDTPDIVLGSGCTPLTALEITSEAPDSQPLATCPEKCARAFTGTLLRDVVAYVAAHPGCSQREVEQALRRHRRDDVRAALQQALGDGRLSRREGRGRAGAGYRVPG